MDYLSHNIGINLKRIRKAKGISLDVVAEQTGVSKSMLAQIERLTANPSIGVLGKITSGLQIDFNDLIATPPQDHYLIDIDHLVPTKESPGHYRVWTCFPIADNNILEIYRIEIEPGSQYYSGRHGEHSREYITIQKGTLSLVVNGTTHTINQNQIFRFECDQDHIYINHSDEVLSFYVTFTPNTR